MNQSFLIFGREPSVSFAELYQYLGDDKKNIVLAAPGGAIINDESLAKDAPLKLAGVIKSGVIVKTLTSLTPESIAEVLQELIKYDGKLHFGISLYSLGKDRDGYDAKKLGLGVKTILKNAGRSVRLVESRSGPPLRRTGNLSSVDVAKNKLLRTGVELCIFITPDGFLIGKTAAVQPYEDYSRRDYDRPGRDAKSGMLPPKLALGMINMAVGRAYGNTPLRILDPFCGSGTVLQEALLLGHNVIGTDIDVQAVKNSKMNLEWLFNRHPEAESTRHKLREGSQNLTQDSSALPQNDGAPNWRVEKADVRQLNKILSPQSVDAIVTEFDLGPPLQGGESASKINSIATSLSDFYIDALRVLRPILKDNGRAVIAWPHFRTQNVLINTFSKLRSLGWNVVAPYPTEYEKIFPLSERGTLLYGRPDQHVWREILLLKKTDRG